MVAVYFVSIIVSVYCRPASPKGPFWFGRTDADKIAFLTPRHGIKSPAKIVLTAAVIDHQSTVTLSRQHSNTKLQKLKSSYTEAVVSAIVPLAFILKAQLNG